MKMIRVLAIAILWLAIFPTSSRVTAGEPTAQLSATIDEFVRILAATPVPELREKGLPKRALALIFARFDFAEMTKRSLGPHWNPLQPSEQREFVEAFTQRLLIAYGRTVRASGQERIHYEREVINEAQATVVTKVTGGNDELDIDYRMHAVEGQWRVYDMVIDRVSIVNNYRAQFDRVIARSSINELLQRLKQQDS
jgi:phospholipid transport system substrate-binding protein